MVRIGYWKAKYVVVYSKSSNSGKRLWQAVMATPADRHRRKNLFVLLLFI